MKRSGKDVPTGVFILAGLAFMRGFYSLLGVLIRIIGLILFLFREGFKADIIYIIALVLDLSFYAAMGGLFILCGSWLISLQPRGWMLATVGSGLYLLLALANISLNGSSYGRLTYVVIAAIILVYLNIPATKRVFETDGMP
ncbi:MAG TPA: hypothetical protein HA349_09605 [Methanotrichaceae archaeon]|nr:hypothetical protein [Methanotrichaceae archaeon]